MSRIFLKYGVNPHQAHAVVSHPREPMKVVNGQPGYINLLDALTAWQLVMEMRAATGKASAASFKHVSPAGAALEKPLDDVFLASQFLARREYSPVATAYARARGGDRMCSFGDAVAVSEKVDVSLANLLKGEVSDLIIAPDYDAEALEILEALGAKETHPEGLFFPDTYHFSAGTSDLTILRQAYDKMHATLDASWETRADHLPVKGKYQALILASIVEKETGDPSERKMVAAVFVNRLRKRMRLQTDPTVIYGLGEQFDGNLRRRDLEKDTPYNTYTRYGLPPTPIAMPGAGAIAAVLHPAPGDSLYFVSRGDGSHYFSGALKEHNLAVDKYQRKKAGIRLPAEEGSR